MPLLYSNPVQVVNNAIRAQQSLKRGSITFQLSAGLKDFRSDSRGTVNYDPGSGLTLRLFEKAVGSQSDRIYRVVGKQFSAYDFYSDEAIHRSVRPTDSLVKRLAFALPVVPDPVRVPIDSRWLSNFLHSLPDLRKFKVSSSKAGIILSHRDFKEQSSIKISFNSQGLLSGFLMDKPSKHFAWTVYYLKEFHLAPVPSGGLEVQAFSDHQPPPVYASEAAKQFCLAARRAFRNLHTAKILVTRPDKKATVFRDRSKIRQTMGSNTWVYDGKNLSLAVSHKFYKGKASRADTLDYLAALANGEDTMARCFLLRANLVDSYLTEGSMVRIVGKMTVRGVPSTVVEISSPGGKSDLVIRNADHLIASAQTDNYGPNGKIAYHDECLYDYLPFKPSSTVFSLVCSSKTPRLGLPKSAIHISSRFNQPQYQYEYHRP